MTPRTEQNESGATQAFAKTVFEFLRETYADVPFDHVTTTIFSKPLTARQASMLIADLVEWTQDVEGDDLVALDERLAQSGLVSLTLVRQRVDREFAILLAKGRITSDDEWRVVETRVSDTNRPLPESDRALASRMLADYHGDTAV